MTNEQINGTNEATVEWDDNCFRFCEFNGITKNGGVVSSTFVSCSFNNVEWYWGIFTHAIFLQCTFDNCKFHGTSFIDARFVECTLKNCNFINDNLNAKCDFAGAVSYNSTTSKCNGFRAQVK